jgi:hypothetical protein
MIKTFFILLGSLLKSAIDCCILPGTANGTEILWLYMLEWWREVSAVLFALLSVAWQAEVYTEIHEAARQPISESEGFQ